MKKVFDFLKKLFNKSKFYIQKFVTPSVQVVELLKSAIDSPAVPLITALIPGNIDDAIAAELKWLLPEVLKVLGYADQCINEKDGNAIVQCALQKIKLSSQPAKDYAWHNIASYLSLALSDGKLSWSEAIHFAEITYNDLIKK